MPENLNAEITLVCICKLVKITDQATEIVVHFFLSHCSLNKYRCSFLYDLRKPTLTGRRKTDESQNFEELPDDERWRTEQVRDDELQLCVSLRLSEV